MDRVDFFVHIDKKVPDDIYLPLSETLKQYGVTLIPDRVCVEWGEFSQVQATLNGLTAIVNSGNKYDYIHFISGQDYPIKDNLSIRQYLCDNKGSEFLHYKELSPQGWSEAMARFERYWLYPLGSNRLRSLMERLLNLLPVRRIPKGYLPYGGSQWWTISSCCATYVLDFVRKNKGFVRFFRFTHCPDEMFFQTIIINSPFRGKVYNDNLRLIDWSEGKANPKTLTKRDFDMIKSSPKLFARKFDSTIDSDILDSIDTYTHSSFQQHPAQ